MVARLQCRSHPRHPGRDAQHTPTLTTHSPSHSPCTASTARVLYVDLDGTLTPSDTLLESALLLLRQHPLNLFRLLAWLLLGRAGLKQRIANAVQPAPDRLPYHEGLLALLKTRRAQGDTLVLASAADARIVDSVAQHIGLFEGTLGTTQGHNLRGAAKRQAIEADARARGFATWGYAGNSRDDLPVWAGAHEAVAVNTPASVLRRLQAQHPQAQVLPGLHASIGSWLRAIRVKQWAKNALLFVPLLAAHSLDPMAWVQVMLAFVAFGLCASATYLFNDLMDLPNDRVHRIKRHRPLAAGAVGIGQAVALGAAMLVGAFVLATLVSAGFVGMLLLYTALTLSYTLWLKRIALVDVLLLSGLYTLRIAAGAVAAAVELSNWLLAISIFLFLSLALVKRCAELEEASQEDAALAPGRGYHPSDLPSLRSMGMASGFLAVMVLALYVDSQNGRALYAEPQWLWAAAPLLLFWIMRMWLKTGRRELHGEDPLQFAMKDGVSWLTLLLMGAVGLAATVGVGA